MATVYLKEGKTTQVSLEDLEDYLYDNHEHIEPRKKVVRRQPVDIDTPSTSSK
jgi:hypothetical protein